MGLFPAVAAAGGDISSNKAILKQVAQASGSGGKNFIKFTKQGEFLMGIDADDITGDQCAFNVASIETGFIGWEDGSVKDEIMVPLGQAGKLPVKASLPEIPDGEGNGWSAQLTIDIKMIGSGDEGLLKGSSGGFIRRFSEFMGEVYGAKAPDGRERIEDLNQIPVVQLDCGGYKHKKYGWINEPKFVLVDWLDAEGEPVGLDEVEEAPKKPVRKKKAKLV